MVLWPYQAVGYTCRLSIIMIPNNVKLAFSLLFKRSNVTHSVLLLLNSTAPILIWMGSHSIQFIRNTDVVTQMAMMVEALYNSSRNIPFIKRQRAATAIDLLWFNRINWKQILPTWVKLKNTTSTSMTLSCD